MNLQSNIKDIVANIAYAEKEREVAATAVTEALLQLQEDNFDLNDPEINDKVDNLITLLSTAQSALGRSS